MNIKIIGKTGDPWATALKNALPKTSSKKIVVLCGAAAQIWCTPLFWIARYRVLWLAGYETFSGISKPFMAALSRLAHAILAPNQAIEAQYLKIGIPGNKLSLVYPPCEAGDSYATAHQDAFVVGCDAETDFEHGLGALIRAIQEANAILGNARLIIGGAITDKNRIEWMAKELGIRHAVRVVPAQGFGWVGQCHVFAFLRKPGAAPSPALCHALSHGLPIMCNDALPHREFVQDQQNGILLKDANSEMLSQTIINLARNSEWRSQLGAASARFARERLNPELAQKKIKALIP